MSMTDPIPDLTLDAATLCDNEECVKCRCVALANALMIHGITPQEMILGFTAFVEDLSELADDLVHEPDLEHMDTAGGVH